MKEKRIVIYGMISSVFMLLLVLWVNFHHENHKYSISKNHQKKTHKHLQHTANHSHNTIKHTQRRQFASNKQGRTNSRKQSFGKYFTIHFASISLENILTSFQKNAIDFHELLILTFLCELCRWNL